MPMGQAFRFFMGLVLALSFTIPKASAEAETLTLSCDGTVASQMTSDSDNKPETVSKMGLLVNLAEGTVLGFNPPARIKKTDPVSVDFTGDKDGAAVGGTIDRITGSVTATTSTYSASGKKLTGMYTWALYCKPTKRVF